MLMRLKNICLEGNNCLQPILLQLIVQPLLPPFSMHQPASISTGSLNTLFMWMQQLESLCMAFTFEIVSYSYWQREA